MATLAGFWASIWRGRAEPPTALAISADHVLGVTAPPAKLVPRKSYFHMTVNELFLLDARKGTQLLAPMVVAVSEFMYEGKPVTVPYVVGPGKLKAVTGVEARSMLYNDTRVAGLHPYTGGVVSLAVILCQVPVDNVADRFLKVLESISGAFGLVTPLGPYLKMGDTLINGVNDLLGLGTTKPLVGWQQNFDYDGEQSFAPGYFVLINGADVGADSLWVENGRLHHGTRATHVPFRQADYVLFSVGQPSNGKRSDLEHLDWYPLWERVLKDALSSTPDALKSMQANYTALAQSILLSPDLTEPQANELVEEYFNRAQAERDRNKRRTFRAQPSDDARLAMEPLEDLHARSLRAFTLHREDDAIPRLLDHDPDQR